MVNEALKNYLLTYHQKGFSYESLRHFLLKQGIASHIIEEAITAAQQEEQNLKEETNTEDSSAIAEEETTSLPDHAFVFLLFSPWRVFFLSIVSGFIYYLWWIYTLGKAGGIVDKRFFIPLLNWLPLFSLSKQLALHLKKPWHVFYLLFVCFWFVAPLLIQPLINEAYEQQQKNENQEQQEKENNNQATTALQSDA